MSPQTENPALTSTQSNLATPKRLEASSQHEENTMTSPLRTPTRNRGTKKGTPKRSLQRSWSVSHFRSDHLVVSSPKKGCSENREIKTQSIEITRKTCETGIWKPPSREKPECELSEPISSATRKRRLSSTAAVSVALMSMCCITFAIYVCYIGIIQNYIGPVLIRSSLMELIIEMLVVQAYSKTLTTYGTFETFKFLFSHFFLTRFQLTLKFYKIGFIRICICSNNSMNRHSDCALCKRTMNRLEEQSF